MVNRFHLDVWEMESYESAGDRDWYRWIKKAKVLAGHDLDGRQYEDAYSLDGAYAAWEAGQTPEGYVRSGE